MDLKGRDFLTLKDYTPEEILYLIDLAAELKDKKKKGIVEQPLIGKNVALIFEKTSTRTRCSFEVAAHDLGMHVTYLDPSGSQIGKKESIPDTARVLGRMFDGIEYRGYGQEIVEELANVIPVDGKAPEILESLEPPTHVFIGGSSGRLADILHVIWEKNPRTRVVVNAISLETVAQITELAAGKMQTEIIQVQVSRAKTVGTYHLMQAENPVYICVLTMA